MPPDVVPTDQVPRLVGEPLTRPPGALAEDEARRRTPPLRGRSGSWPHRPRAASARGRPCRGRNRP
eukprot:11166969-Lingulodinium_polyedra.AAC.1